MRRALVLALAGLALAAPAQAYFAPGAAVLSASSERQELADSASQSVAVSGDGRFAAFATRATNLFADDDPDPEGTDRLGGIFRRDLASGLLRPVADGDLVAEADGSLIRTGARNPSVSADGRYVAFSTGYALVPGDTNGAIDVYVRDLDRSAADAGAYTLVSARDGSDAAATYGQSSSPAGQQPGSDVWPLTSISADGRRVVFRTTAASDLPGGGASLTPASQLLVRDLGARTTRVVTRAAADGEPAGGAIGPAALSADGTAVVWAGSNARAQTKIFDGEPYDATDLYDLWQRIGGPTRRITGLADPDDPACTTDYVSPDPSATGPCYGPLTTTEAGTVSISGRQLAISGDGNRIWYLTPGFPRPSVLFSNVLDVWSADMSAGVTRKAGAVELSREGALDDPTANPAIDGLAVSPDGRWLALSTQRTRFGAGRLTLSGSPRAVPDQRELYVADLGTGVMERVVTGFGGDDASGSVGPQVSLSADGRTVGFTSSATNLFYGDANGSTDAFTAVRTDPPAGEAPVSPGTGGNDDLVVPPPPEDPKLRVRLTRDKHRRVVVSVTTPAAGRLALRVRGRLPASGGRRKPLRTFAVASKRARAAAKVRVTLELKRALRGPLKRFGRLSAGLKVVFTPAAGGRSLAAGKRVRFLPGRGR